MPGCCIEMTTRIQSGIARSAPTLLARDGFDVVNGAHPNLVILAQKYKQVILCSRLFLTRPCSHVVSKNGDDIGGSYGNMDDEEPNKSSVKVITIKTASDINTAVRCKDRKSDHARIIRENISNPWQDPRAMTSLNCRRPLFKLAP